jgi:hypothetical protein
MPTFFAVFQPTVIDMSRVGASGVSGCDGGIHGSTNSRVPGTRHFISGDVDRDCTPPATITRSMPDRICAAPFAIAVRLPVQCRLTAWPGTSVIPQATAACRARSPPP